MLNYFGFTVAQLRISGLEKHMSGGRQDTKVTVS